MSEQNKSINVQLKYIKTWGDGKHIELFVASSKGEYDDRTNSRLSVNCTVIRDDGIPLQETNIVETMSLMAKKILAMEFGGTALEIDKAFNEARSLRSDMQAALLVCLDVFISLYTFIAPRL